MSVRVAVAAPAFPQSIDAALEAVGMHAADAAAKGASVLCFPETFLPGYPDPALGRKPASREELKAGVERICGIARRHNIALVVPMDWYEGETFYNVALVVNATGEVLGRQAKNQLDPSEDGWWTPGDGQRVFDIPGLRFGVVICHEGFRYPESVRWMARQGAQLVFHPNCTGSNEGPQLSEWGHKSNPYYEKAQMVRALENTIFFAPSNYSFPAAHSASSIIAPDGTCLAWQEYGVPGIAVADVDTDQATALLAKRLRPDIHR
jgi:predicted amidohydrolase